MKKKFRQIGLAIIFSISLTVPAEAAIPVIDDQNIAQQLKTYTETLNVVKNTAEQISLQLKELMAMPENILNEYKQAFNDSIAAVKNTLSNSDLLVDKDEWDEYWKETYPRISSGDYKQTVWSERSINDTLQEIMSMRNEEDVNSYHELMAELEKSKVRLQDLLEQNKTVEGNKQAQQIANMIATEKANIDSINTAIQAITDKNQLMHQQAEVLKAQNRKAVMEAGARAEREEIEKMKNNVVQKSPIIDSPFEKYGNASW
ncbi:hypothetical protein DWZ11_09495 [Megamonas rupellensis]|uniref:P-type conjugative transfer protein TrbJ n=1 Tax=Megamonas rupellensis TaxID=491921 RepID=A0A411ZKT1_9FIRM|nr:hypothetical protein [Megamonas rupellensis]RGQ03437.1 hypothetical protein DWZ11_09495 [Megamonas rupellensis]